MARFNQCRLGAGIITGTIATASLAVTSYLVYVLPSIEGMAVLSVATWAGLAAIATLVFGGVAIYCLATAFKQDKEQVQGDITCPKCDNKFTVLMSQSS